MTVTVGLMITTLLSSMLATNSVGFESTYNAIPVVSKTLPGFMNRDFMSSKNSLSEQEQLYKRALNSENLEAALNNFIEKIRNFMYDSFFDDFGFEQQAEDLENEITTIAASVEKVVRRKSQVSIKFKFANNLFQTTVDSLEYLRLYKILGPPEHRILHYVIDLNIRLLALHDPHCLPDPESNRLAFKISGFSRSMAYWEDKFNGLVAPYGTRRLFRLKLKEAKKAIEVVKVRISEKQDGISNRSLWAFLCFGSQLA